MPTHKLPPALPTQVYSPMGPVPVLRRSPGKNILGSFKKYHRVVKVRPGLSPEAAWQTFWHEIIHLILWDAGAHNQLTKEGEETLCDAIGTYLTAAMLAGHLTVPTEGSQDEK